MGWHATLFTKDDEIESEAKLVVLDATDPSGAVELTEREDLMLGFAIRAAIKFTQERAAERATQAIFGNRI